MRRFSKGTFLLFILGSLFVSACSTISLSDSESVDPTIEPYGEEKLDLYLGYSIGKVHIQAFCPDGQGVIQYETEPTRNQWLLGLATLWIYSPTTLRYWCG